MQDLTPITAPATPLPPEEDVLSQREEILAPLDPSLYSTLRRMAESSEYRLVISLGGGAVPGLCGNAALMRIVEELELRPHVEEIWGTSAGAVVGGGWATGAGALDILDIVRGLARERAVDVQWWRLMTGFLLRWCGGKLPDALLRGDRFHRAIASGLRVKTFEECLIPFRCIACTDGSPMQRHVFRNGSLLRAISASMSLPGVLLARNDDGTCQRGFYDGGLVEKTPLRSPIADHLHSGDQRRLLLLGTHYSAEHHQVEAASGFIARFTATILAMETLVWNYQHAEASQRPDVTLLLLDPHISDSSAFDFTRTERSYLETRRYLKDRLQNAKLALSLATP